jgi:peptide/nickel transport system substrate-binding protein
MRLSAFGLLAVLLATFVATAAGGLPPPKFTPDQMGGTLRGNFNFEPQTLNPLTAKDLCAFTIQQFVLESLIDRDPDTFEFKPVLADRWTVSDDGLLITFHLDPRAKFSDGSPVTADDVLFTYETMMNPKIDARSQASYFEDCKGLEKIDDRTVKFTWKKPYFLALEFSGGIQILPKHLYQFTDPNVFNKDTNKLVGSGPYKLKAWTTGQNIILERNENYWNNPAAFDTVIYQFILEEQPAVQALLAGEIDFLAVSPEWWVKFQGMPEAKARFNMYKYTTPRNGYSFIGWNNVREPFTDARVRRAMTQLIWREQILKYMMFDIGKVSTGPFWSESPQCDPAIQPWPYDREAARKILKEAGWWDRDGDGWLENADGKHFEFALTTASGDQNTRDECRVLSEEFRRMGIVMNVRLVEWSVFSTILDNRDFDAVMLAWGGSGVEEDPFQIWHSSQIADQGSNMIGFKNAEADRLIEEIRKTLDMTKRNELCHQFHQLLHREQPYTFMFERMAMRVVSNRLHGTQVHKMGMYPTAFDWWMGKDGAAPQETKAP